MFYLKKLIAALILPPTGPILLALVSLWVARRHRRTGITIAVVMLLALFALSLPLVATALMRTLEIYPPISAQQLDGAQAIVILGGDDYPAAPEYGRGTVGAGTLERLRYGAELQRRTGLPILVTGGALYGNLPQGETMKAVLERDFGAKVRWAETRSRDTTENAAYSAVLLKQAGISRIALLSHGWHLRRAVPLFERQGLQATPAPTKFSTLPPSLFPRLLPSGPDLGQSYVAVREWLGILAQRIASSAGLPPP